MTDQHLDKATAHEHEFVTACFFCGAIHSKSVQDIADERVKQAWKQSARVAFDYEHLGIFGFKEKYGTTVLSEALKVAEARAAEGEE